MIWVPSVSNGNCYSALSQSRRPLPFSPPLRHHATKSSRREQRQEAGFPSPSRVSCSLDVHLPGSGLAGKNTVRCSPPAPEVPVCLGGVEAGCGLTASGFKSANRYFLVRAGSWSIAISDLQFRHCSVRWAPRRWRRLRFPLIFSSNLVRLPSIILWAPYHKYNMGNMRPLHSLHLVLEWH